MLGIVRVANVAGEPREFCLRRTQTDWLGKRLNNWTYPLFPLQSSYVFTDQFAPVPACLKPNR
jgi:hypothetical protein